MSRHQERSESGRDAIDDLIAADLGALETGSDEAEVASLESTSRALATSLAQYEQRGAGMMKPGNRGLRIAIVAGALAVASGVFAATHTELLSFWVDTEGKTDPEVEAEIRDELRAQGVDEPEVEFKRGEDSMDLSVEGKHGDKRFEIVQQKVGEGAADGVVAVEMAPLDSEREPGMTDAELEAKIRRQLEARGLVGEVIIEDGKLEIRAWKDDEHATAE